MPSLLLEIGCEELPASACREAAEQLRDRWLPAFGAGTVYAGPRRLALHVTDLAEREPDQWVKGPPERLRDKAAAGFARKHGVAVEELEARDGFLGVLVPGRTLEETIPERLAEIVEGLSFSKSMVWETGGIRFSRPVRWLCAKVDDRDLDVAVAGVPSGGRSSGHRFTHGEVDV
ncbi:MAG TPA: glycine--tRNA ligase subunit beta, partial [Gaiellaceae bacterium]|nr:glycine--tRNA ligase subunit beta [Gaiellaceae bacterium]